MSTKQTEALKLARDFISAEWGFGGTTDIEPSKIVRMLEEALAEQPAQQEPVLWQILNGVCHAGVRSTENLAREAAAGMQKAHDLGGSLAAFHVRPLYTSPPASKPLTDEQVTAAARVLNDRQAQACGVDKDDQWKFYSDDFKADARAMLEAAHNTKGDA